MHTALSVSWTENGIQIRAFRAFIFEGLSAV